jgi:hypothetical protein
MSSFHFIQARRLFRCLEEQLWLPAASFELVIQIENYILFYELEVCVRKISTMNSFCLTSIGILYKQQSTPWFDLISMLQKFWANCPTQMQFENIK